MDEKEAPPTADLKLRRHGSFDPLSLAIRVGSTVRSVPNATEAPIERSPDNVVFLHEHNHLVQATTTVHGLLLMVKYLSVLPTVSGHNERLKKIRLPIIQNGKLGTEKSREWWEWCAHVEGDLFEVPPSKSGTNFAAGADYKIDDYNGDLPGELALGRNGQIEHRYRVDKVRLALRQRGEFQVRFGAGAICESLAGILTSKLVDGARDRFSADAPDPYPYGLLRKLANFICERKSSRKPSDVELATFGDRALMTPAPGHYVVQYLEGFARNSRRPASVICDNVDNHLGWKQEIGLGHCRQSLDEHLKLFSVSPKKARFFGWFMDFIDRAITLRRTRPDFYVHLFEADNPWAACDELLKQLPPPLIVDGNESLFSHEGAETNAGAFDASRWLQGLSHALQVTTRMLRPEEVACPLYSSCKQPWKETSPTGACKTSPWDFASRDYTDERGTGTCSVGSAFAAMGVKDKVVDNRH